MMEGRWWSQGKSRRSLLLVILLCSSIMAQDQLHETGMPEGLEVLDFTSEEEMDRVLFHPQEGVARFRTLVIGIYEPECREMVEDPWFTWGAARHSDPALVTVARIEKAAAPRIVRLMEISPDKDTCLSAAFVPRGGGWDNMRGFPVDLDMERDYLSWVFQQMRVEVTFDNAHDGSITLHYVDGADIGSSQSDHVIEAGGRSTIQSFVSHVFYTRDVATGRVLDWVEVEGEGGYTVGRDLEQDCSRADEEGGSGGCEEKEVTLLRFVYGVLYRGRMALNAIQPGRVERLTERGFERHKLPREVYAPLRKFWDTQQDLMLPETRVGPAVNQLDSPTYILVYPDDLKDQLYAGIKPMLEGWSGRSSLIPTSCYGIRKYTNGSRLLMHVDTMDTHAVSGIINVHQEGVQENWELEILDHDGKMHRVVMEPGDIVFYESAKLLHGRPKPFNGVHYANIFIHTSFEGWSPKPL